MRPTQVSTIIPTVRCRRMQASIDFCTRILDFECVEGPDPDPKAGA